MESDLDDGVEGRRPGPVRRELLLHGAIVGALALVFLPLLLHPTEVLYNEVSDLLGGHLPYRHLMAESLRERGRLPRYDPTAFGGIPLIGDPQSGIHYPPNWLHALGSEDGGPAWFGWWILIHLCIGGFGVSWWLRGQGHSPAARLAGTLTFALSGKWLLHVVVAGHVIFAPLVWIPWQLGFIDRLEPPSTRRERSGSRFTSCAMLAVVTALAITGLHPQLLLYSQTLVALYAAAWLAGRYSVETPSAASGALLRCCPRAKLSLTAAS